MKKLFFILIVLSLFSCDFHVSKSELQGKWEYETSSVYESIEFDKSNFKWIKMQEGVETSKIEGTYQIKLVSEDGNYYNVLFLSYEGAKSAVSFKILIVNQNVLKIEGTTVTSYYREDNSIIEKAKEASK